MSKSSEKSHDAYGVETRLTHEGRWPEDQHGFVNTPVTRGSTVLFPTLADLQAGGQPYRYGRTGNPTTHGVETLVTDLEGAAGTVLAPSGLSAISTALFSCLQAGDELLMTDSVYQPTRKFCDGVLTRFGVTTRYYDPRIGAGIADLVTDRTRAIFTESPGSLTFEIQDLPAIAEAVKDRDITILADNSWATPLYYRPLELGADIVVHAGTKMFIGHSDAMFGTVSANEAAWPALVETHRLSGTCASPDDAWLAARGLRTLGIRMKEHQQRALLLAEWLEGQAGVARVLHPALPSHPDNAVFMRDFTGAGSLFAFILEPGPREALAAMVDDLELFGMGFSWGGYESLLLPTEPWRIRTAVPWEENGPVLRVHTGFEDAGDLMADLEAGLKRYRDALG